MATTECPPVGLGPRTADFVPPRWLANPHLQTLLASSGLRRRFAARRYHAVEGAAREYILDCGAGVRLQGFHTAQCSLPQARGLVVLLHGWEGSAESSYMLGTSARLLRDGCDVFRLNFRDHGATHALNRDLFHSCRLDEVVGAVRAIAQQFAPRALALAGFSLGGNFALRVALRAPTTGIDLRCVVAVCPVVSPERGLYGLEHGLFIYRRYFLHKWRRSLRRKQAAFPDVEWFSTDEYAGDLRELTRLLVLRHTDFGSLENYLAGYSIAGDRLRGLALPAAILTAADDPVIPVDDFRGLQLPPGIELDIASHGGHCGFIRGLGRATYAEDYVAERVLRHFGSGPEARM